MRVKLFLYKFRDRLDCYSDLLPVFCLFTNIAWVIYVFWNRYNIESNGGVFEDGSLAKCDYLVRSIIDYQIGFLFLMFCKSKNYRLISWFSFCWLCLWWALNEIYVIFDFSVDRYYTALAWIIFPIFAVFASLKLTNRC